MGGAPRSGALGICIALLVAAPVWSAGCKSESATATQGFRAKPTSPRVVEPIHNRASGSSRTTVDVLRPMFSWRTVSFEKPVSYDVEITSECEPGQLLTCAFARPVLQRTGIEEVWFQPAEPLPVRANQPLGQTYAWRVRACAGNACSPWTRARNTHVGRAPNDLNGDGHSDVAVGAPLVDGEGVDRGSVFVYFGNAEGLSLPIRFNDPDARDGAAFGVSVATLGDVNGDGFDDLLVGAAGVDDARGRAYLYFGAPAGMEKQPPMVLRSPDGDLEDWFGAAVMGTGDIDGDGLDDFAVGAPGANREGRDWGLVYIYRGATSLSAGGSSPKPRVLFLPSPQDNDHFGESLARAGDLNGDGYGDFAIGAPGVDLAGGRRGIDRGAVYVYHGSADGLLAVPAAKLEAPVPVDFDYFGASIAAAGDTDVDGYEDLLVGAPGIDSPVNDHPVDDGGSAYLFRGGPSGVLRQAGITLEDPDRAQFGRFGASVTGLGDIDHDGAADIAIGTRRGTGGRVAVFHGHREGLERTARTILIDPVGAGVNDFGDTVSGIGDVNGDGYRDLAVGAAGADNGGTFRGSVVLYPGTATGIDASRPLKIDDPAAGAHDHFGRALGGR